MACSHAPGRAQGIRSRRKQHKLLDKAKSLTGKPGVRVEHTFQVIKQQFGFAKVHCRGLEKSKARLMMLFAQSNPWMARKWIMGLQGYMRLRLPKRRRGA